MNFSRMNTFVTSLLLLAIATTVQSNKFIPLHYGTSVKFGGGYQEDQLPFTECKHDDTTSEQVCHVYLLTGEKCRFTIYDADTTRAYVKSVHQMLDNKVIIITDEFDARKRYTGITSMDMNVCLSFNFIREKRNDGPHIVVYPRKFDVIMGDEIQEYNSDGLLMKEKPFLFHPRYSVTPFSARSKSKNLFVVSHEDGRASLNLVSPRGNLIKQLLDLGHYRESVNHGSQSMYAFCWSITTGGDRKIECRQFDEYGNVKYSERMNVDGFPALKDVRNLKNGGVVLFMFTNSGKNLDVVRLLPNREAVTVSYQLPEFSSMTVTDFDEQDGTFKLAYESKKHRHGISLKKFKLPL